MSGRAGRSVRAAGEKNLAASKACSRRSMWYTARASLWAKIVSAFPLPCFCVSRATYRCATGFLRKHRTAASENAHFKWALPIFVPEYP